MTTPSRATLAALGAFLCLLIFVPGSASAADTALTPMGYPRQFSFREVSPKKLPHLDWMTLVVSDFHLRTRAGSDIEFKEKHPDRPVLIQINSEGLGLWGTWICLPQQRLDDIGFTKPNSLEVFPELTKPVYPIMDFPGHWVYEAGADATTDIPADSETVTIGVADIEPFRPSSHPHSKNRLKRDSFMKDIVICPRDGQGKLDWLRAEFASIESLDEDARTITVRRWTTRESSWRAHAKGTYLAPNANLIVMPPFPPAWTRYLGLREAEYYTPFVPNVTRMCPRDPRTGLNAAEWLAKHYVEVKRKHYAQVDGYVFDVSAGTFHPSTRISTRSDCDVDGRPDYFYFDGLDFWALGMWDFMSYLRDGVDGKFEGLGDGLAIVSDANMNEENRFFDLLNGGEWEFAMINPFGKREHAFSSNLDRYLLWCTRARTPRLSYIHNKFPNDTYHGGSEDDLLFYMHDNYHRLDIAAACMGTGYVANAVSRPGGHPAVKLPNRQEQIEQYGTTLPLDWDEYHCGDEQTRNWLGMPVGDPVRLIDHLRELRAWQGKVAAILEADAPYEARLLDPQADGSVRVEVDRVDPWIHTSFKIRLALDAGEVAEGREYTVRFQARAPSPYAKVDPKYSAIPRNLEVRLSVGDAEGRSQEALVFSEQREVFLTLPSPADGNGRLEFGLAEEPGEITLSDIALYEGCADVMYRRFENGLALLNGSAMTPYTFELDRLVPGEAYRRIRGGQDPTHNSGERVGGSLTLGPRDGILLKRM